MTTADTVYFGNWRVIKKANASTALLFRADMTVAWRPAGFSYSGLKCLA